MSAAQIEMKEGMVVGGRYRIEDLLGMGGLGMTYVCRDLGGTAQKHAAKILNLKTMDPGSVGYPYIQSMERPQRHPSERSRSYRLKPIAITPRVMKMAPTSFWRPFFSPRQTIPKNADRTMLTSRTAAT